MDSKRIRKSISILLSVLLICMNFSGCGNSKDNAKESGPVKIGDAEAAKPKTGDTPDIEKRLFDSAKFSGKTIKWSSDALTVSLEYPESYSLRVTPGSDDILELTGPGEHDISLKFMPEPQEKDPALFISYMNASFDRMELQGYQEFDRRFMNMNGSPAAYLDYKWNVMKRDFRTMELNVLKGDKQYVFLTVYLLKDDNAFKEISRAVFNSIQILPGAADLAAVKEEMIKGTGVPLPPSQLPPDGPVQQGSSDEPTANQKPIGTFALTSKSTGETAAMDAIKAEFGNSARMADWNELKSTYTTDFGAFFAENGIKDQEARWVTLDGQEFNGNRHYFIQRFDAGKPDSFGAHDSIGPIYLGSWYGIEMPSLILKPAKQ